MDTLPRAAFGHERSGSKVTKQGQATNAAKEINVVRTLRKRWFPALTITAVVFVINALYTFTRTPQYQSDFLILLDAVRNSNVSISLGDLQGGLGGFSPDSTNFETEVQIFKSGPVVRRALEQYGLLDSDLNVGQVTGNLSIKKVDRADVLLVSYRDPDPDRAKAVLNALAATYVKFSLERKLSSAKSGIEFIEAELPQAQRKLQASAMALRRYKEKYNLIHPEIFVQVLGQRQKDLSIEATKTRRELHGLQQRSQALQQQLEQSGQNPQVALSNSVLSQDSTYQTLVNQLRQVELDYAEESVLYQDSHPALQNLKDNRVRVLGLLRQHIRRVLGNQASDSATQLTNTGSIQQSLVNQFLDAQADLETKIAEMASIRLARAELAQEVEITPVIQQGYVALERQTKLNGEVVERLAQKLQELKITEAQENPPWRILESPYRPSIPVTPNIPRNLLLGLVVGGLLGVLTALLLERADDSVRTANEAKELTGLPLLALAPKLDPEILASVEAAEAAQSDPTMAHSFVAFSESISALALSLRYLGSSGEIKVIALTSSVPSEGKSTITYYLAEALAKQGRRVLIIDADMRRPTLHQRLEIPNIYGLSSAIATEMTWAETLRPTEIEGLEVITAGPIPPNPVSLLSSPQMVDLMAAWRDAYDYVLIDTPPMVGLADAQAIAPKVDGLILVASLARATRSILTRSMEIFSVNQINPLGLVVNAVAKEHGGDYSQDYSSYYTEAMVKTNGKLKQETEAKKSLVSFLRRR